MLGVEATFVQSFMAAGVVRTSRLYTGAGFAKEALDEGVVQSDCGKRIWWSTTFSSNLPAGGSEILTVFGAQEGEDEAIEFPFGHLSLEVGLERLPVLVGVVLERHEQSGLRYIGVLHREPRL